MTSCCADTHSSLRISWEQRRNREINREDWRAGRRNRAGNYRQTEGGGSSEKIRPFADRYLNRHRPLFSTRCQRIISCFGIHAQSPATFPGMIPGRLYECRTDIFAVLIAGKRPDMQCRAASEQLVARIFWLLIQLC